MNKGFFKYLRKTLLCICIGVFFVLILLYSSSVQSYVLKKIVAYVEQSKHMKIKYADFRLIFPLTVQINFLEIESNQFSFKIDNCTCRVLSLFYIELNAQNIEYTDGQSELFISKIEMRDVEIKSSEKILLIDSLLLNYLKYKYAKQKPSEEIKTDWQINVLKGAVIDAHVEYEKDEYENIDLYVKDLKINVKDATLQKGLLDVEKIKFRDQLFSETEIEVKDVKGTENVLRFAVPHFQTQYDAIQIDGVFSVSKTEKKLDAILKVVTNMSHIEMLAANNEIRINGSVKGDDFDLLQMPQWLRERIDSVSISSLLNYDKQEWAVDKLKIGSNDWWLEVMGSFTTGENGMPENLKMTYGGYFKELKNLNIRGNVLFQNSICDFMLQTVEKQGYVNINANYQTSTNQIETQVEVKDYALKKILGQKWGSVDMRGMFSGKIQKGIEGIAKLKIENLIYNGQNYGQIIAVDTIAGDEMSGFLICDNPLYQSKSMYLWSPSVIEVCGDLKLLEMDSLNVDYDVYCSWDENIWKCQAYFPKISNSVGCLGNLCMLITSNKVCLQSGDLDAEISSKYSWSSFMKGDWTDFLHRKGKTDFILKMQYGVENIWSNYLKQKGIYTSGGMLNVRYQKDLQMEMLTENIRMNDVHLDSLWFVFDKDHFDMNGRCLSAASNKCMDVKLRGWIEGNRMYAYLSEFQLGILSEINPNMPDIQGYCNLESTYTFMRDLKRLNIKAYLDSLSYKDESLGDWRISLNIDDRNDTDLTIAQNDKNLLYLSASPIDDVYKMWLQKIPLSLINVFMPENSVLLSGDMEGNFVIEEGVQTGDIKFQQAKLKILPIETSYELDSSNIMLEDNKLLFDDFKWIAPDQSTISMDGYLDRRLNVNMDFKAQRFQFIKSLRTSSSLLSGDAYADIKANLSGSIWALRFKGWAEVLNSSKIWYHTQQRMSNNSSDEMIRFVDGYGKKMKRDTLKRTSDEENFTMQILAQIEEGVDIGIDLSADSKNRITVKGDGDLIFSRGYGQNTLTGKYNISEGTIIYNIPIVGEHKFEIQPGSMLDWTGNVSNPIMNIMAQQVVQAGMTESNGSNRIVHFVVKISVIGELNHPEVNFDLQIPNDVLLQSQLSAYSSEERARLALNLLVYGTYNVPIGQSPSYASSNALTSFMESGLNQWSRRYLGNVGLAFGVNTVNRIGMEGQEEKQTHYSYRYSRSLFDDRINVRIGGSVAADKNLSPKEDQRPIDDIGLEYLFPKHKNLSLKAFRQETYESAFDGDVTRTGVGIMWRKDYWHIMDVFRCKK